jgi:hypothetical protein
MFKTVEYVGFDGHPELRARAEQATRLLGNEITSWRDEVEVVWSPAPGGVGELSLALSLALGNGVSASALGTFGSADFADDDRVADRCGRVWMDLLGILSRRQMCRVWEAVSEPAEV